MPQAIPSARYDMAWKAAISHAFRPFMTFFFPLIAEQIEWGERPRFRDKELVAIGFGNAGGGLVADKLVEVRLRVGEARSALIHIEVQVQRDDALAGRILDYNYRLSKELNQHVASVVVLADEDRHWHPRLFHREVLGLAMTLSFATSKLPDFVGRDDELLASHNPFAWVTLAHLRTQQARHDPDLLYAAKWELTKCLYQHRWSRTRIMVLFKVINWMMALPEPYQQRYWRAVHKLEKERKMEWITPLEQSFMDKGWQKGLKKGIQQGKQQGREQGVARGLKQGVAQGRKQGLEQGLARGIEQGLEQGLEQGRKQGALALLERQLVLRFGALPKTVQKKLAAASLAQLQAWSDRLPEAESLQRLFK